MLQIDREVQIVKCKHCGAPLMPEDRFCIGCGKPAEPAEEAAIPASPAPGAEPPAGSVPPPPQYTPPAGQNAGCGAPPPYSYGPAPGYGAPPYGAPNYQAAPISGTGYVIWTILATLFCCMPFGIPGIVFALQIDRFVAQGNIAAAQSAAKKAKTWAIVAMAAGVLLYIFLGIVYGSLVAYYIANPYDF